MAPDRCTILIPTYNRPALVQRLVRYYRQRAPTLDVVILDSGRPEAIAQNSEAFAAYGESVRHLSFPGGLPPLTKILRGLELTQTPFVVFCADDDLVFPQALSESIAFLGSHSDHVSAHGVYLNFRQDGQSVHLRTEYSGPSIDAGHAGARVFRLLQRYESLFYGVYRTADLRQIFAAMQAIPSDLFIELFQSVATVIKGKVKRFPIFYAARQSGPRAEPERKGWQTYYWFAENPTEVVQHYAPYCDELVKFYEAHSPAPRLDPATFARTLHLAHSVYFAAGCPPEYFHSALQQHWPEDRYVDVRNIDLLDDLRPGGRSVRKLNNLWQRLWRKSQSASLSYGLASLNRAAGFSCHLPVRLRWLGRSPEFRTAWTELCAYLRS